jgi:hypothetical protein
VTINLKTNVRTVVRYKGQEYSSLDQLPPEARAAFESAMAKSNAMTSAPEVKQHIVLNGQHFDSLDQIPAEERKLVDDAMACAREKVTIPISQGASSSTNWFTPAQLRLVLFAAAVVGLVVALRLLS